MAVYPGRELHVILDNLNTHKPKHDRWLARHPTVHFHFTPTHGSWLNLSAIWFSILARTALAGASFTAVPQLRARSTSSSRHGILRPTHSSGRKKSCTRDRSSNITLI
ncbi:MAG: transposase [Gemmatimonadales bacterium]